MVKLTESVSDYLHLFQECCPKTSFYLKHIVIGKVQQNKYYLSGDIIVKYFTQTKGQRLSAGST